PINHAAGKDLALAGTAFAHDESPGNASGGVGVLAVVHGQGEEVNALARFRVRDGGGQDDVIAHTDDGGTVRLLGQLSRFKRNALAAGEINRNVLFHDACPLWRAPESSYQLLAVSFQQSHYILVSGRNAGSSGCWQLKPAASRWLPEKGKRIFNLTRLHDGAVPKAQEQTVPKERASYLRRPSLWTTVL